jgi:uncharacterized protein (DUF302 family)
MLRKRVVVTGLALGLGAAGGFPALAVGPEGEHVVTRTVEGSFDDVRLDLENAILNRGLVIDYEGFVGDMLNRTAADVGATTQVYTRADMLQFCSAVLSRTMVEADPANLGFCPYIVFLYETPETAGTVTVGYRRLPETGADATDSALAEVNALLEGIVSEVAAP